MVAKWPEVGYAVSSIVFQLLGGPTGHNLIRLHFDSTIGDKLKFSVAVGMAELIWINDKGFFPLHWMQVCVAFDSNSKTAKLAVDGSILASQEYGNIPSYEGIVVLLGMSPSTGKESPGRITNFNIFSSALSAETLGEITRAGQPQCGVGGDILQWDDVRWNLRSKAKLIEIPAAGGPCRQTSRVQFFLADFKSAADCLMHCERLKGRSPPVTTAEEWDQLTHDLEPVFQASWASGATLPLFFLSITEGLSITKGSVPGKERLPHWPMSEEYEGKVVKTESLEDVWRDYYTGKRLVNFTTMPFEQYGNLTSENCAATGLAVYPPESSSSKYSGYFKWLEVNCDLSPVSCVCQYPAQPIMYLRGGCPETYLDRKYIALQESVLDDVMWVGIYNTRIEYDLNNYQWRMEISDWGVTAHSRAEHRSYILGKHNWTIHNDYNCNGGNTYTTELKATGCNLFGDFTCDSGQCVRMEQRCDQVSHCWDKSDEVGCQLIVLENNYNKNIPFNPSGVDDGQERKAN